MIKPVLYEPSQVQSVNPDQLYTFLFLTVVPEELIMASLLLEFHLVDNSLTAHA